jgi:hypothetical protein
MAVSGGIDAEHRDWWSSGPRTGSYGPVAKSPKNILGRSNEATFFIFALRTDRRYKPQYRYKAECKSAGAG